MAEKSVVSQIKLHIGAGSANPSPPVGPALGQHGVNIMEFCNAFNDRTKGLDKGMPIPVVISVFSDRSFTFEIKTPLTSYLLKQAAGVAKGSGTPNLDKVGKVTREQLIEIVNLKNADLTSEDLEASIRTIAGSARSMGIEVIDEGAGA